MVEELEDFLSGVVSPELTAVYVDAAKTLVDAGITNHLAQIDLLIDQEDNLGRDQLVNEIDAYLKNAIDASLNQYGVFLNEGFTLKQASAVLRSINTLDDYDDVETIEAICISEESPEERLAALVELTSEYIVEDILLILDRVNPALLKRLLELVQDIDDGLSEMPVERTSKIVRIKSCIKHLKDSWLMEYVDAGGTINRSLADMIVTFRTVFEEKAEKDVLLAKNVEEVALQLVSFVLASNVEDEQLMSACETMVEETFNKVPLIIKYMDQVRTILSTVKHEQN